MRQSHKDDRNTRVDVDFMANPGLASDFNPAGVVNLYITLPDAYALNLRTPFSFEDIKEAVYLNQPIYFDMPFQQLSDISARGSKYTWLDGQAENVPDRIDLESAVRSLRGQDGKHPNMHEFELPTNACSTSCLGQNNLQPGFVHETMDESTMSMNAGAACLDIIFIGRNGRSSANDLLYGYYDAD